MISTPHRGGVGTRRRGVRRDDDDSQSLSPTPGATEANRNGTAATRRRGDHPGGHPDEGTTAPEPDTTEPITTPPCSIVASRRAKRRVSLSADLTVFAGWA